MNIEFLFSVKSLLERDSGGDYTTLCYTKTIELYYFKGEFYTM